MRINLHESSGHEVRLLWVAILLVALITFLVDIAGWFPLGFWF